MIASINLVARFVTAATRSGHRSPQKPRPALSEARFARLLATPASQRGEAIERIARMLARTRTPEVGINCKELRVRCYKQTIRCRSRTWLVTTIAGSILPTATQLRKE